ncbi:hypothetical protein [Streptomyces hygroscopicus]|uniref:hypothetical protein n=1 Tax=Streptomyces hygroscopicus TaxID=1912 RepID=UPI001FCB78BE|nr:hypothetical protein [Streptomyces hygroscopicus]BDH09942.1 hypothetical protein HOK021_11210 [Streptomyces hygroscopicus]
MRSRQLALCATVAACAVMTTPAYGGEAHATGTGTVSVTPASAAPGGAVTPRAAGRSDGRAALRSTAFADAVPLVRPATGLSGGVRIRSDAAPLTYPGQAAPVAHPASAAEASPRRELSSTSAVGLVLAGGAILVIAGQLLRLRLRLRRERRGDEADEH